LIGELIRRFPNLHFGSIILIGSVLPANFEWKDYRSSVYHVRNEVAQRDNVNRMVSLLKAILPGFGTSGSTGFLPSQYVHSVSNAKESCAACRRQSAKIHNVTFPFGHSDYFVGGGQADSFWLPFLWGLDPPDYLHFIELCVHASRLEANGLNPDELADIEGRLLKTTWGWAGCSLEIFVEKHLKELSKNGAIKPMVETELALLVHRVVRATWNIVYKAQSSGNQPECLYPRKAVDTAAKRVARTMRSTRSRSANSGSI